MRKFMSFSNNFCKSLTTVFVLSSSGLFLYELMHAFPLQWSQFSTGMSFYESVINQSKFDTSNLMSRVHILTLMSSIHILNLMLRIHILNLMLMIHILNFMLMIHILNLMPMINIFSLFLNQRLLQDLRLNPFKSCFNLNDLRFFVSQ